MKELERDIGATYRNSCNTVIMTKTQETFPGPEMPTIIPDTGIERPKTDKETTYIEKKNIEEAIR